MYPSALPGFERDSGPLANALGSLKIFKNTPSSHPLIRNIP
jgi:hypothetical protein